MVRPVQSSLHQKSLLLEAFASACLGAKAPAGQRVTQQGQLCVQELTEILGRSNGVVLMTPPRASKEAQAALATMVSALKSKHKVGCPAALPAAPQVLVAH